MTIKLRWFHLRQTFLCNLSFCYLSFRHCSVSVLLSNCHWASCVYM